MATDHMYITAPWLWHEVPPGDSVGGIGQHLDYLEALQADGGKSSRMRKEEKENSENSACKWKLFKKIYQHLKVNYVGFKNEYQTSPEL